MSSQRRKDSSRANGAHSHGPVTPEGLARCQAAPITHGLTAHRIVLELESEDDFRALRDTYLAEFQPQSAVDLYLVDQLVAAHWRLDRASYIETALLDLEVARQEPQVNEEFVACDNETRTALAFRALCAESRTLNTLDRYEARLQRNYYRTLEMLTARREKQKSHKGPNPTNGQCATPPPTSEAVCPPTPPPDAARPHCALHYNETVPMKNRIRSTTVLCVRRNGKVVMAGDGQVTLGQEVLKASAKKLRRLYNDKILAGFAGSTADAFALFGRFESKLEQHSGNLSRSVVELAKEWRMDKALRHLEALLLVADLGNTYILSGSGDVIEPDDGIAAIGSGGPFAKAAAAALIRNTKMEARKIVEVAMEIAGEICVYTNDKVTFEELG